MIVSYRGQSVKVRHFDPASNSAVAGGADRVLLGHHALRQADRGGDGREWSEFLGQLCYARDVDQKTLRVDKHKFTALRLVELVNAK